MRLKFILLTLLIAFKYIEVDAGCGYGWFITINDTLIQGLEIYYNGPTKNLPAWIGKVYVNSYGTQVYFHPGDTVYCSNGMFTEPGQYPYSFSCEGEVFAAGTITLTYLPDSLEAYYLSHFDQPYMDSVKEAQDSLATIAAYLVDRPNAILYPNPIIENLFLKDLYVKPTNVELSVYDMDGRNVLLQSFEIPAGIQSKVIDLSMLLPGIYLLRYSANETQIVQWIVKL